MVLTAAIALAALPMLAGAQIADNVAAADEGYVRVGWLGTIVNWNPLCVEMVEDHVAMYLMYSTLYMYDQDWGMLVPSLATSIDYDVHANGSMTTTITITDSAYFRNVGNLGDTSHQLTAYDVVFTFWLAKNYTGATFDWYLQDYSDFQVIDKFTFSMWCTYEKAILINDICDIPILPKYVWQNVSNPLASINPMDQTDQMTVSGAFVFESMLKDAWYKFKRAPNYHGATDYPGYMDVDEGLEGIIYTVYSDTRGMTLEMNEGTEDTIVLTGDIDSFLNTVGSDSVVSVYKAAVQENGICDVAINAIPNAFRAGSYCTGNPVLLDPLVRMAIMMTLNKSYINNSLLGGYALEGDSVVQPGFWHKTIENQLLYDPAAARALLEENGWEDLNGNGYLEATAEVWGVQQGLFAEGTELAGIRCQAPDTDTAYGYAALAWQGWAEQAGIGFVSSVESEVSMINQAWYQADYDIWVWYWGWGPEPISGALSTWMTSEIEMGGNNCQTPMGEWWAGYWNYTDCPYINASMIEEYDMDAYDFIGFSSFDQNISIAMKTMDINERKAITDELQQVIYESYTENPPFYDLGLYAFTDERFMNWGDLEAHPGRTVTSSLLWIWYDLTPTAGFAPVIDVPLNSVYEARRLETVSFSISVSDPNNDPLTIEWDFGDGSTATDSIPDNTVTPTELTHAHVYDVVSNYSLKVTVSDSSIAPDVHTSAVVVITSEDTTPPTAVAHATPAAVNVGETVYLDGSDSTDNILVVNWTWSFYDGASTVTLYGETTSYVFYHAGEFSVELSVGDAAGNTAMDSVMVTVNGPPVANAGDDVTISEGDTHTFDGSGSSDDGGVENYTWTFQYGGTPTALYGVSPQFMFSIIGDYSVILTVKDAQGLEDDDTVLVRVLAYDPPIADAGPDVTIDLYTEFMFDSSGSSADVVNYTWTFEFDGDPVILYGDSPLFMFDIEGEYVVNLTVTDQLGLKGYDEMTVTVAKESVSMGILILAGAAVALIGAAIVVLLLLKRRGDGTGRAPPPDT